MVMDYLKRIQAQLTTVVCFLLSNSPASEFQTPGKYPEESIQHSENGESLKSRIQLTVLHTTDANICLFDWPMQLYNSKQTNANFKQ
jgi:hypothetical protein